MFIKHMLDTYLTKICVNDMLSIYLTTTMCKIVAKYTFSIMCIKYIENTHVSEMCIQSMDHIGIHKGTKNRELFKIASNIICLH